jgi:hypothetical protein
MSHAEKCPVCNGTGKVHEYPLEVSTAANPTIRTCHGCMGLGWVTIQENRTPPSYIEPRAKDDFHKRKSSTKHRLECSD